MRTILHARGFAASILPRHLLPATLLVACVAGSLVIPHNHAVAAAEGAHVLHVTPGGKGDGTSWSNGQDLQAALMTALPGDQLWVAAGVYKPVTGTDRTASFQLKDGVALYGGFAGTEIDATQRDPGVNLTILSGDLLGNDVGALEWTNPALRDNSYHVVIASGTDSSAILDGFTVSGGNANAVDYPNNAGGGMLDDAGNPQIRNVIFHGNAAIRGGGMYTLHASPTISAATFDANVASFGGGMYNVASSPTLSHTTWSGNSADQGGGIFNQYHSAPRLTDAVLLDNHATNGGGMLNYGSTAEVDRITLSGNSATNGGAIYNQSTSLDLAEATVIGNSATTGGAIYNLNSSHVVVRDSLLSDNRGGEIDDMTGSSTDVQSSDVDDVPSAPANAGQPE